MTLPVGCFIFSRLAILPAFCEHLQQSARLCACVCSTSSRHTVMLASGVDDHGVSAPLLLLRRLCWLLLLLLLLLQSVVLYSLPELDGAIDTVPLGGLVGDDIFLVPERVTRLASRLHK
jgi:hypothetical protein